MIRKDALDLLRSCAEVLEETVPNDTKLGRYVRSSFRGFYGNDREVVGGELESPKELVRAADAFGGTSSLVGDQSSYRTLSAKLLRLIAYYNAFNEMETDDDDVKALATSVVELCGNIGRYYKNREEAIREDLGRFLCPEIIGACHICHGSISSDEYVTYDDEGAMVHDECGDGTYQKLLDRIERED